MVAYGPPMGPASISDASLRRCLHSQSPAAICKAQLDSTVRTNLLWRVVRTHLHQVSQQKLDVSRNCPRFRLMFQDQYSKMGLYKNSVPQKMVASLIMITGWVKGYHH